MFEIKEKQVLVDPDQAVFIKTPGAFFLQLVVVKNVAADHLRLEPGQAGKNPLRSSLAPPVFETLRLDAVEDID